MRFVTYLSADGDDRVGRVIGDHVYGLEPGLTLLDLLAGDELLASGQRAENNPHDVVTLAGLTLRAPLQPRSIRDYTGFRQHVRNCYGDPNLQLQELHHQVPAFYFSNVAAVIGPHDDVPIPPNCERFDYELEVCAVIGKSGSNIAFDRAEEHIAGYMMFCDWSCRDLQRKERVLYLGPTKGKDSANTLGPMLVTADELAPYRSGKAFDLAMTGYVNGRLISEGRWNTIDWGFPDMITYASRGTRLRPGDVLGSGTVPTGCLLEQFELRPDTFRGWLQPGDEVRLVVEQLGELRHRVVEGVSAEPLSTGF